MIRPFCTDLFILFFFFWNTKERAVTLAKHCSTFAILTAGIIHQIKNECSKESASESLTYHVHIVQVSETFYCGPLLVWHSGADSNEIWQSEVLDF